MKERGRGRGQVWSWEGEKMGVWHLTGMCSAENGEGLWGQEVRDWLPFQWNALMEWREGAEPSKLPMGSKQHTQSLILLRIRVSPLELSQFPSYHTRARSLLNTRLCFPLSESPYCCRRRVAQSCLTLCNPMDCSPPGSSVHGISEARILKWVATFFSRGFFRPRDWIFVSCLVGGFFTAEPPRKLSSLYWFSNGISGGEQGEKRYLCYCWGQEA